MSPVYLGTCLECGLENTQVSRALVHEEKPTSEVEVLIALDSSRHPARETRRYPARYSQTARCIDRAGCSARIEAIRVAEQQARRSAESMEPVTPAVADEGGATWFD